MQHRIDAGAKNALAFAALEQVQLFITIASVGYFYFSNIHTLSTIFARDFSSAPELATRHDHAVAVVLGYLRP